MHRVSAGDARVRMPRGGEALDEAEVETLRLWIDQGAEWESHWAFIPPERPVVPPVADAEWPRNDIDGFVLRRLEAEGLAPSDEADRATLLRRVTLDLTGVPPTPVELADFLNDDSADAYEEAVDRLLASPRYGERMAVEWLDAARYARHQRLPDRRRALDVALARLGHRRLQRQHAVSTGSPSSSSRATCCPARPWSSAWRPRSTATTA